MIGGVTVPLNAAQTIDTSTYTIKVFVAPVEGGQRDHQEYFNFNLREEVKGGGYDLTNSLYAELVTAREKSDFYITTQLSYDAEYDENIITMYLYDTRTGKLILSNGMSYTTTEMMNDWNLTLIYRLMANAPIDKRVHSDKAWTLEIPTDYWWYLGAHAGYSLRFYKTGSSMSLGSAFEGGVLLSFMPSRFLGFQAEALFSIDNGYRIKDDKLKLDEYSLMFPLLLKGNISFGRIALALMAGPFFIVNLTGRDYPLPLMGVTGGLGMKIQTGPGNIMVDIRYSNDLGGGLIGASLWKTIYNRNMISLTLGYEWGIIAKPNKY